MPIGYDYSKGTLHYEEMRGHLSRRNMNNKAYQMGMEIILSHGLKHFLNKFRRKDCRQDYYEILTGSSGKAFDRMEIVGTDGALISLLSEMIQSAGNYYGTNQKDYN